MKMLVKDNLLLLPHDTDRWSEIKSIISSAAKQKFNIHELISHLDYIENLVHLSRPTSRLFDLLPVRMTFVGLGTFIAGLPTEEQEQITSTIFPFIFQCALEMEQHNTMNVPYCVSNRDYSVSVPFNLVVSIVASSFLCLLPTHPTSGFLMNEANFTHFFTSITDPACPQAQKLRSLLMYFEHCRISRSMVDQTLGELRITRRVLPLNLPPTPSTPDPSNKQLLLDNRKHEMVRALSSVPLPYLLVDQYRSVECVADRLQIPMTHFVNAYVGGSVLRSDLPNEDSLFMRYPDLLTCLPICHRLEDGEALWIDHYRGPFLPTTLRNGTEGRAAEVVDDNLRWRRLVIMDSSCFPNWATDLQYSGACIISETIKASAALFGVSLPSVSSVPPASPFSASWWRSRLEHTEANKTPSECKPTAVRPLYPKEPVLTNRASRVLGLADNLIQSVLDEGRNHAWGLRAGLSASRPAQTDQQGRSSMETAASNLRSDLVKPAPSHSRQGRGLSFQFEKYPLGLSRSIAMWYRPSQSQSLSFDPSVENIGSDTRSSPRVSLTGSFTSGSTSYSQSSGRSSLSRGRSLSTQSSLRRMSDLSSTGSSWFPSTRVTDGPSGLHEVMEHEAETSSCSAMSPFVDTVDDLIAPHQFTLNTTTSHAQFVASEQACSSNGQQTQINPAPSTSTQNRDELVDPAVPTTTELMRSAVQRKHCLMPYVNGWIQEACNEATSIACTRNRQLHQFATDLSHLSTTEAVKTITWFDQWSHKLLLEAIRKANQLHLSPDSTQPMLSRDPTALRRISRSMRCCHRMRGVNPKRSGGPVTIHEHCSLGPEPPHRSFADHTHAHSSGMGFGIVSESYSLPTVRTHNNSRACFHASTKRQHYRLCGHLNNNEASRLLKYLHLDHVASADRTGSDAVVSITNRRLDGLSKRGHSTGPHSKRTTTCRPDPTTAFVGTATQPSDPSPKWGPTKSAVHRAARIHVTDRLYRFAGSVATECCALAMQRLRCPRNSVHSTDSSRESDIRPAGVVTSSWGKHTINSSADPQLKVMTQWIAAAAASSVLPTEHVRSPIPDGSEATVADDDDLSSSVPTPHISTDHNPDQFSGYRVSPLIVCTNNDPRLKELESLVSSISAAGCSAGALLALLFEYGMYRLSSNDSSSCKMSVKQCGSTSVQSLFDFIRVRLGSTTRFSGVSASGLPVC